MKKPLIKLAYRQLIDGSARSYFERDVFNDTYAELLMQAPVYNREKKFTTVAEMIAVNPKANSLHYKVGFAIGVYVNELNKKIPNLTDCLGHAVHFDIFKTEIVHSDITNREKHVLALTYITSPLWLVDSFDKYLVLAKQDSDQFPMDCETFTMAMQPNLSIVSYKVDFEV